MKRCAIVFVIINVAIPIQPQLHMQYAMWCRFITNLCFRCVFFLSLLSLFSCLFFFWSFRSCLFLHLDFLFFRCGFTSMPSRSMYIRIFNIHNKCNGVPHKFGRLTEKDKSQEQFFFVRSSFQNQSSQQHHNIWAYVTLCYEIVTNSKVNRRLLTAQKEAIDEYTDTVDVVRCRRQFTGFKNSDNIFRSLACFSHIRLLDVAFTCCGDERQPIFAVMIIIMNASRNRFIDFLDTLGSVAVYLRKWMIFLLWQIASILISSNDCQYDYWPRIMITHIFETNRLHCKLYRVQRPENVICIKYFFFINLYLIFLRLPACQLDCSPAPNQFILWPTEISPQLLFIDFNCFEAMGLKAIENNRQINAKIPVPNIATTRVSRELKDHWLSEHNFAIRKLFPKVCCIHAIRLHIAYKLLFKWKQNKVEPIWLENRAQLIATARNCIELAEEKRSKKKFVQFNFLEKWIMHIHTAPHFVAYRQIITLIRYIRGKKETKTDERSVKKAFMIFALLVREIWTLNISLHSTILPLEPVEWNEYFIVISVPLKHSKSKNHSNKFSIWCLIWGKLIGCLLHKRMKNTNVFNTLNRSRETTEFNMEHSFESDDIILWKFHLCIDERLLWGKARQGNNKNYYILFAVRFFLSSLACNFCYSVVYTWQIREFKRHFNAKWQKHEKQKRYNIIKHE